MHTPQTIHRTEKPVSEEVNTKCGALTGTR